MIKKIYLLATICLWLSSCGSDNGNVTIKVPEDFNGKTLVVSHTTIDNIFNAKRQEDLIIKYDTLDVKNGIAGMSLDPAGAARYNIESPVMARTEPEFYAAPGDELEVTIRTFEPLDYEVKGTELMEDITHLLAITNPIQQERLDLINNNENITEDQIKEITDRYDNAIKKFVADNPKSPAIPLIIRELSGDDFKKAYDNMTPEARNSILMPFAELYNRGVEEMQQEREAEEARNAEFASGTITAPDFTLPDLEGKNVSLTDFKGKWIVLDFWGTWREYCIKGFPDLKEAYSKYGDTITIISIDCKDSQEEWREGVKKYGLPWINLYNGYNQDIYDAYTIEGFPTKVIINPEGKIVDHTTGEDPSFFTRLSSFVE